jgi:hypothetical protein
MRMGIQLIFLLKLAIRTSKTAFKIMKHIITAILVCASSILFAQSTGTVDITINGQTTREQLAQMRNDLQSQGIVFNYAPQFDNERHLIALKYKFSTSEQVLIGEGEHDSLQQTGANVIIHVNPSTKFYSEEKNAAPHK